MSERDASESGKREGQDQRSLMGRPRVTDGQIYAGCTRTTFLVAEWTVHRDTLSGSPPPPPALLGLLEFSFLFITPSFSLDFSGYLHIYTTSTQPIPFHFRLLLFPSCLCISPVPRLVLSLLSRVYVCMLSHVPIISPPGRMHGNDLWGPGRPGWMAFVWSGLEVSGRLAASVTRTCL